MLSWEDWSKVAFASGLFAYAGWEVIRSLRNTRRAGAVLVDCGYERGSEPSWIVIGGLGCFALFYWLGTLGIAASALAAGGWSEVVRRLPDFVWPIIFFPFAIWTLLDRGRKACEHGLLWNGVFVPWSNIVGWGKDAAARLWIVNSSPGADRMTLWIDAGRAADVEAIVARLVVSSEGDRARHP